MSTNTYRDTLNCCTAAESTEVDSENDAATTLDEIRSEEIPADVAAIRSAGFRLLLDTGTPVTVEDLIAATDIPAESVAEIFDSVSARGRVEFNDQGQLIGLAGLSLTPSRHELTIGGSTRYTWCALDAVGILGALKATGTVRSADPQTGDPIEIEFQHGTPKTNVHLFILGGFSEGNVREDWCPRVNFFTSRQAAEEWVANHSLDGDIVSVADIADDAAAMWRPVVEPDAAQVC